VVGRAFGGDTRRERRIPGGTLDRFAADIEARRRDQEISDAPLACNARPLRASRTAAPALQF
jgi:hypothetical protein